MKEKIKEPDLNVLIESIKETGFDCSNIVFSFKKLEKEMIDKGYDVSTLEEDLFGQKDYLEAIEKRKKNR